MSLACIGCTFAVVHYCYTYIHIAKSTTNFIIRTNMYTYKHILISIKSLYRALMCVWHAEKAFSLLYVYVFTEKYIDVIDATDIEKPYIFN